MKHPLPVLALLAGLACASVPPASSPVDWARAAEPWSVLIVTVDPDGDERATRIWLVAHEGVGAIRTGETRWRENLDRDPLCRLRVGGAEHRLRAEPITDPEERHRIDAAFRAKYGWQDRMLGADRAGSDDPYFQLRPAGGTD